MMIDRLSRLTLSIFAYMIAGYMAGLIIGFTVFDPNSDVYALLGVVLPIVGLVLGLIPVFQRRVYIVFGLLIGLYLGMLLSILIWGDPITDDLLVVVQRGGIGLILALVFAVVGGFVGSRIESRGDDLVACTFLLGGFLGGAVATVSGMVAHRSSMVAAAPFVIGSGVILALIVWRLRRGKADTSTA